MVPYFSNRIFYIQIYQNGEGSGERICSSNPLFFYHFCQKLSFSPTFCLPHYDEHYPVITSLCTITNIPIGSVSSSLLTSMFAENCLCHYLCLCLCCYLCLCLCHSLFVGPVILIILLIIPSYVHVCGTRTDKSPLLINEPSRPPTVLHNKL